jgi:endo-1,4-beta-D-glucanase Y
MNFRIALLLGVFLSCIVADAQKINTPVPTVPFGKNQGYRYGTLPSNLPTTGTYGTGQDAADAYIDWYGKYVRTCADGSIKVRWDSEADAVSEGVAYGMIISAYMGDKELFDGLWKFYLKNVDANGLMNWKASGCSANTTGGAATDAEVDAAMALIVAEYQWPGINTPYDYAAEATKLITAIKNFEVQKSGQPGPYQLLPGDMWGPGGNTCRNPSYIPMGYLKTYGEFVSSQKDFWQNQVVPANYSLLLANIDPSTGLNSDWCSEKGVPGGCGDGGKFGDDACRGPWRSAIDAMWYGGTDMKKVCTNIAKYCASKGGPASAPGDVNIDGTGSGSTQTIYRVMFGVGVMGASTDVTLQNYSSLQNLVNAYYTNVKNSNQLTDKGYFPEILRMISMMVMTGNFWKPGSEIVGPPCTKADLGPDQTICGVSSIVLSHGSGITTGKTFKWYKSDQLITNASGPTYTATAAGKYKIVIDSLGCVKTDEMEITGTLPKPALGKDTTICTPSSITLDSKVTGNAVTFSWIHNDKTLSDKTSKLSDVRIPGTYKITVSASGCTSQSDTVVVTSNNPTPVDGCSPVAGNVKLSITNANSGPYQWFKDPTSGTALGTGTSYTANVNTTTTFYVQDAGSMQAKVGLSAANNTLKGGQGRGSAQTEAELYFDALSSFTLDFITVEVFTYSCNESFPIKISVYDASAKLIGSSETTRQCTATGAQKLRVPVNIKIEKGTNYKLSATGSTSITWYQDGVTYPLSYPGILNITKPGASWAPNSTAGYFDWEVSTGNNCSRLPVVARIDVNCDVVTSVSDYNVISENISVYPNPAGKGEAVKINTAEGINHLRISDLNGNIITERTTYENVTTLNESEKLAPGVYIIELSGNGLIRRIRFVKM